MKFVFALKAIYQIKLNDLEEPIDINKTTSVQNDNLIQIRNLQVLISQIIFFTVNHTMSVTIHLSLLIQLINTHQVKCDYQNQISGEFYQGFQNKFDNRRFYSEFENLLQQSNNSSSSLIKRNLSSHKIDEYLWEIQ